MSRRAHFLQHIEIEGLGSIEPWLRAAGYAISGTRFFEHARLPQAADFDLLIVMGGPMSVNDEHLHPWLVPERQFVRACIDAGKSVLGICLGAQLIAAALGARVYASRHKEIGWFPVEAVSGAAPGRLQLPQHLEVFHWHGETFDLPAGAVHLARSEACENQAFQVGPSVIGLQFHLEVTPAGARSLASWCRDELLPSTFVQDEATILAAPPERYRAVNAVMAEVLGFLQRRPA